MTRTKAVELARDFYSKSSVWDREPEEIHYEELADFLLENVNDD